MKHARSAVWPHTYRTPYDAEMDSSRKVRRQRDIQRELTVHVLG